MHTHILLLFNAVKLEIQNLYRQCTRRESIFFRKMEQQQVLFDVYTWDNTWTFTYEGDIVFSDGTVHHYSLNKEDGLEAPLQLKLSRIELRSGKTLNPTLMALLHKLANETFPVAKLDDDTSHSEIAIYRDNGKSIIIDANSTLKLAKLLKCCLSKTKECAYCSKGGANRLDEDTYELFCDESCHEQFEKRGKQARVARRDVQVMMMRPENGRRVAK